MDDLHALKQTAADAWEVYEAKRDEWQSSAPGNRTDACIAMMNAGTAYNAAWDEYEKAVRESNRQPQKEAE